jgi:hypothetical protein
VRSRNLIATVAALLVGTATHAQQDPPRVEFIAPPPGDTISLLYSEVATLVLKVGQSHNLCWGNTNVDGSGNEATNLVLQFRRYRVEGGPMMQSQELIYSNWTPNKDASGAVIPRSYCADAGPIPQAGHWVYEVKLCYLNGMLLGVCSNWVTAVKPATPTTGTDPNTPEGTGAGSVDDRPKGWWIYAYLPAPTGIET